MEIVDEWKTLEVVRWSGVDDGGGIWWWRQLMVETVKGGVERGEEKW